jgi:hypothetical protein
MVIMTDRFLDSQGVPIGGYDRATYPATAAADYDACIARPVGCKEPPVPAPHANEGADERAPMGWGYEGGQGRDWNEAERDTVGVTIATA